MTDKTISKDEFLKWLENQYAEVYGIDILLPIIKKAQSLADTKVLEAKLGEQEKRMEGLVEEIIQETICPMCRRLNPQHSDCKACEDIEDCRKRSKPTGGVKQ